MKIAIIGSGSIAGEHALAIQELKTQPEWSHLRLDSVVGRRIEEAEAFAKTWGMRLGTTDLDSVLANPEIDAVIVTSPTDLHADQTARALRAGKHVLCEIPLATSLKETDSLIELCDAAELRLMVCQTQRYHRALIEAKRQILHGEIALTSIVSRYLFNRRNNVNWKGRDRSWTDNLLWHHTCHAVDATLWLLGEEAEEIASQIGAPDPETGIPMNVSIIIRTASGTIGTVVTSYHAIIPQHDYLMIGRETSLNFVNGELYSPEGLLVTRTGFDPLPDSMPRQNEEFFRSIQERREPAISARSVRPAMAVLQQVQDQLDRRQ